MRISAIIKIPYIILFLFFWFSCADDPQTELLRERVQTVERGMTPRNAREIMIDEPKHVYVSFDGSFSWEFGNPSAISSSPIAIYFTKDSLVEYVTGGI